MGRLFWKFFLIFWLAQLATSIGVGVLIWASRPESAEWRASPPQAEAPAGQARPGGPPPRPPHRHDRRSPFLPPPFPIIAGSLVSLVFAAALAWYFARPIRTLRGAFERFAGGALDTRVGGAMGRRRDELADLGSDFDRMATRLQGLVEQRRRLLHEVSHELRSPLARLQVAAELMRQQPERGLEFAERIERESQRMDRLIGELLDLDRMDAGIADADCDLREVIDAVAADAGFEAAARRCAVAVVAPETAPCRGNAELLCRAIENVVRNAIRFSPEGGTIGLDLRAVTDGWQVEVADRGPGVEPGEFDAIFEPFHRAANNDGHDGYGLGLALTRRVVEAHGGSVAAANRDGGGLRVRLRIPARPAPVA